MADLDLEKGISSASLLEGQSIAANWRGQDLVVVRQGGKVCAFAGKCTHLQAPLAKGLVVNGQIRCPFHHARFDLATGEAVSAPAFAPLAKFQVVEESGTLRVTGEAASAQPEITRGEVGRVLIVGGGAAGHACAEMLARHGAGGPVTLLSADDEDPYDRTVCSKDYLSGKMERQDAALPSPSSDQTPVTLRKNVTVARIMADEKIVETTTGERIGYDALILATGATPLVPDFTGNDRADVYQLRTLQDADALIEAADKAQRAIIVGSSYIGLEAASSLVQRGISVSVISQGSTPLEKTAGQEMGSVLQQLHESKGVTFHMDRDIAAWDGAQATLDDGSQVSGDFLLLGTGVMPNTDLAEAAGLALADKKAGGGVQVDAQLRTSQDGIYAIGDIANVPDPRLGHGVRVEHWAVAQHMGQWLARHLLGLASSDYADLPFFWSGQYDMNIRYIGHVASPKEREIEGKPAEKDVAIFFSEGGEQQALLTCGRDQQSLETEAAWEAQ